MKTLCFTSILFCLPWLSPASELPYTAASSPKKISAPMPPPPKPICAHDSYVEAKAGYFFFTSSGMRHIYDKGGVDVQVSGAYSFLHWLRLYGSVEYLQRAGYSRNGHQPTSIWAIPLSIGLQPFVSLYTSPCSHKKASGYFSLGPRYFFAHAHNHSDYVQQTMDQNGLGGFVNVGLLLSCSPNFTIDLFGEYSYCKLHFHSSHFGSQGHDVQVGGLAFGGGWAYLF
jgi:hypothetical protein